MQTWYNHACIIDYSILTHLTSITGRYLYLMWIEDRLEKWKWIKTNLFNKQVENIFFFLELFHMILIQELLSGMHFLKILSQNISIFIVIQS